MLMSACSLAMPAKLAMLVCAAINSINPRHLISSKLRVEHGGTASTGSSNLSISSEYLFPGQLALEAEHARQYTLNIDRNVYVAAFGKASLAMSAEAERVIGEHLVRGIAIVPHADAVPKYANATTRGDEIYPFGADTTTKIKYYYGAANNLPDELANRAAQRVYDMCAQLGSGDVLLALVSGGGSALLSLPIERQLAGAKLATIKALVRSGADINELNTVRQSLSRVKGGKLAALAHPARVVALVISDVIGDPLDIIASGPTSRHLLEKGLNAQKTQALAVLSKYSLLEKIDSRIVDFLRTRNADEDEEQHRRLLADLSVYNFLIGNNDWATQAMSDTARTALNYTDVNRVVSNSLSGEAKWVGEWLACFAVALLDDHHSTGINNNNNNNNNNMTDKRARILSAVDEMRARVGSRGAQVDALLVDQFMNAIVSEARATKRSFCLISGGETTVDLAGSGESSLGGRNQELTLAFEITFVRLMRERALDDKRVRGGWADVQWRVMFTSFGSDGIDGPTDAAGAFVQFDSSSLAASAHDLLVGGGVEEMSRHLASHDSYTYFKRHERLVKTGATGTNVSDLQLLLIDFDN